jgi:hypothetical protein
MRAVEFSELVGKRIAAIRGAAVDSAEVEIDTDDGARYAMFHEQDCCEHVRVVEVHGEPNELAGALISHAEESTNGDGDQPSEWEESWTWTFYRLSTDKGPLVLRWLGTSNGYYSERVDFVRKGPQMEEGR